MQVIPFLDDKDNLSGLYILFGNNLTMEVKNFNYAKF
jgi:hypothetical protein